MKFSTDLESVQAKSPKFNSSRQFNFQINIKKSVSIAQQKKPNQVRQSSKHNQFIGYAQMHQKINGPSSIYTTRKSDQFKTITEPNQSGSYNADNRQYQQQQSHTPKNNFTYKTLSRPLSGTKFDANILISSVNDLRRKSQTPNQNNQIQTSNSSLTTRASQISIQRTVSTGGACGNKYEQNQKQVEIQNQINSTLMHLQKLNKELKEQRNKAESPKHSTDYTQYKTEQIHLNQGQNLRTESSGQSQSLMQFVTQVKIDQDAPPRVKRNQLHKKNSQQIKNDYSPSKILETVSNLFTPSQTSSNFRPSDYIKRMIKGQQNQRTKPHKYYMNKMREFQQSDELDNPFQQIFRDHFIQSFHSLGFCSVLQPVDPQIILSKTVYLNRKPTLFKTTVVLDLDETLIHCNENISIQSDVILAIEFPNGEIIKAGVNVRPYAIQLLQQLTSLCEVIVFTASHQCYASKVLDHIDPTGKLIHHRLFRDHCVTTEEGVHIKDLRILADRDLKDVVLVDNAAYSFGFQLDNGIPVIPFYDNKDDTELVSLLDYLKSLFTVNDVREVNRKHFKTNLYAQYENLEDAIQAICF